MRVPIRNGLFEMSSKKDEQPHLTGSKCRSCGSIFFPKQVICSRCMKEDMNIIPLGRKGILYVFTIVRQQNPAYKGGFPYAVGVVELPEGIRVLTLLETNDFDKLRIGMDVELTIDKVYEDDNGDEVMTFKFKPY